VLDTDARRVDAVTLKLRDGTFGLRGVGERRLASRES
jgi:hypothetical protein